MQQGFTIDGEIEEGKDYREQLIFVEGEGKQSAAAAPAAGVLD